MKITTHTPLKRVLELGMQCNRCGHCCSHGSGFLVREDHRKIAKHLKVSEKKLKEKFLEEIEKFNTRLWRPRLEKKGNLPYGKCIFLKDKLCKIHKVKPLQCRIGNCSENGEKLSLWFTLNYFLNENDPESVRQYAVYLKSGGKTLEGAELKEIIKDKDKLKKILEYKIMR